MASTKTANYFSQIFTTTFDADVSDDDESRQKEYEEKKKLCLFLLQPSFLILKLHFSASQEICPHCEDGK